jgi:hypothetical protein
VGLDPGAVYWMDVSNASYYINSYMKITKIKVAKWGAPKKKKKKIVASLLIMKIALFFERNLGVVQ